MNPNLCRVVLRPRGPLEVFDLGLRLVGSDPKPFLRLAGLTLLPVWLVVGAAAALFPDQPALVLFVTAVAALPLQAPFTLLGGKMLFQAEPSVREVLRELVTAPVAPLMVWFVQAMTLLLGLPICGWGWLILAVPTLFVAEAGLLERVGFSRMMRRSSRLASAYPGHVAAGVFAYVALLGWCVLVMEGLGSALLSTVLQLGAPFGSLFTGTVTPWVVLGLLIAQPIYALYRILLYVDVRTRVEGWDLQVQLRAAGMS